MEHVLICFSEVIKLGKIRSNIYVVEKRHVLKVECHYPTKFITSPKTWVESCIFKELFEEKYSMDKIMYFSLAFFLT